MRKFIFLTCSIVLGHMAEAQATGGRFIVEAMHPWVKGGKGATVGLGLDHDFSRRFSIGLDYLYGLDAASSTEITVKEVCYRTAYSFSDNDASAVYMGSFLGVAHYGLSNSSRLPAGSTRSRIVIPVGIRAGVRGGLDGFFADLFLNVGYALGSGELIPGSEGYSVHTNPLYFSVGLALGGGKDQR